MAEELVELLCAKGVIEVASDWRDDFEDRARARLAKETDVLRVLVDEFI
jgi:hypothetical protein